MTCTWLEKLDVTWMVKEPKGSARSGPLHLQGQDVQQGRLPETEQLQCPGVGQTWFRQ